MRGKVAKKLRKLAANYIEAEHATEVLTQESKKTVYVADATSMMGFKPVTVVTMLRQHHPKSLHAITQLLKKSYRQYRNDGSPVERLMVA